MRLRDCLMYLAGSRRGIMAIARSRAALAVGALLVFTGSIARNYDAKDLIAEWGSLLHGIVVSTLNALALYTLVYGVAAAKRMKCPKYLDGFLSFLGLFWMTAPMAWLYAVPYEQFQSPVDAVYSNAWTLAFVSVWRVLLITRALQVIWNAQYWAVLCIVLLFSDVVVFMGTRLAPVPMVDLMGGLQHAPEEAALSSMNFLVTYLSVVSFPVWFIAVLAALAKLKGKWSVEAPGEQASPSVWALPLMALAALAPAVWIMQPQQRARHEVEEVMRSGRVEEGMTEMTRLGRGSFPPVWDPPPRLAYGEEAPSMNEVRSALTKGGQAEWVRAIYLAKSWRDLIMEVYMEGHPGPVELAADLQSGRKLDDEELAIVQFHLEHDERMTDDERIALRVILEKSKSPADQTSPPG